MTQPELTSREATSGCPCPANHLRPATDYAFWHKVAVPNIRSVCSSAD
jgi:hypothetical protein